MATSAIWTTAHFFPQEPWAKVQVPRSPASLLVLNFPKHKKALGEPTGTGGRGGGAKTAHGSFLGRWRGLIRAVPVSK
jgi:hypothetical protein